MNFACSTSTSIPLKQIGELKDKIKQAEADLDSQTYAKYSKLTESEVKTSSGGHQVASLS